MDGVIVVAQKTGVHPEVVNQIAEHPLTDRGSVVRGGRHQLGGRRRYQIVQRARHSLYGSRY